MDLEPVSLRSVGKFVVVYSDKSSSKIRHGILRFFGTVEFASGLFCGIELDAPLGKHNGSFKGIRYFQCAPDHGIFVTADKVYTDSKNKSKPNISSNVSNFQRGKLKRAQSDVYNNTSTTIPRGNRESMTDISQIPSNSNLFDILSGFSNDLSLTNDDKKLHTPKFIPPIVPSRISSKYALASVVPSTSFTRSEPKHCKSITPRPNSVTNSSNRNSLAFKSFKSHKNDAKTLIRHSSLTEINDNDIPKQSTIPDELVCIQSSSKSIHDNLYQHNKPIQTSTGIEQSAPQPIGNPESTFIQQQNILAQSIIPNLPNQYEFCFHIKSFGDSIQKFGKESEFTREIVQYINIDNCHWDKNIHILQEQFRKLKDDIEVLSYQHLEILSTIPNVN